MRVRNLDRRVALPLSSLALVAVVDLLLGPEVALIALLVVGPILASLSVPVLENALVALVALAVALALGSANHFFGEDTHLTRVLPVVVAAGLSIWAAWQRGQRARAALLLTVQGAVARILNESRGLSDAAPRVLRTIGEALGWQLARLWEVSAEDDRLRLTGTWSAPGISGAANGGPRELRRGEGLAGRVWERGEPLSVADPAAPEDREAAAGAAVPRLVSAFAFPVLSGEVVVGVVELGTVTPGMLDRPQLDMLAGMGGQLGQHIERTRAEEIRATLLEREHEARLAAERAERAGAETLALLDTLLDRAPVGFAFVDRELRYVRVNKALAEINGTEPGDIVGRTVDEVIPELPQVVDVYRRVLATGEPVVDAEITGETSAAPHTARHWLTSYYPVRDEHRRLLGVGAVVVEITERKRAEMRADFLAEATAALNSSLDFEQALAQVVELVVPRLADWCAVDAVESGRMRRLAIAHADPAKREVLRELDRLNPRNPIGEAGPAAAIASGRPQRYLEIDDELLRSIAYDDRHFELLRRLGLRSAMVVPLMARGKAVGALSFAWGESGRRFDAQDVALAEQLAARAGAAMENARLYEERSYTARTLQASLLPPRLPEVPGFDLAARYRAAGTVSDVGGDFYDVFATDPGRWSAVLGDVLGKGPTAAAMIGLARHTLRAAAMREPDSRRILETLNEALHREGAEESVCTAVYLAIDCSAEEPGVELTIAGHPLPLVRRADGAVESVGEHGTMLGALAELELRPQRVRLDPGDALVMFTDGVVEARSDGSLFGEERLRAVLQDLPDADADALAGGVEQQAIDFQGGEPSDDLAVLVVRRAAVLDARDERGGGDRRETGAGDGSVPTPSSATT